MGDGPREQGVRIDWRSLSEEALRGLVESFVNREGTDYGDIERGFDRKIEDVVRQLERGEAEVVFDAGAETANIVPVR